MSSQLSIKPQVIPPGMSDHSDYVKKCLGKVAVEHQVSHAISTRSFGNFFTFKGQLRSLKFGLISGIAVLVVFGFTVFNEMIVAPFIHPGGAVEVPAVDAAGLAVDASPKVRIPKINVEIPVDYSLTTTNEKQVELALDSGVVHYPTTVLPGQPGNAAFFGHSSNNIFNPGKYKFAFVLLHELENGDTFYLTSNGTLYTYQVVSKRTVKPSEVGVLGAVEGQPYTATLITCDPPGTSINRLVVVGKQINPVPVDDTGIAKSSEVPVVVDRESATQSLPGNGPGLLTRIQRTIVEWLD